MSDVAKGLQERRASVWEQMKSLAERAAGENRDMDAAELGQWDSLNGELDGLDKRIDAYVEQEKRAKEQDEKFAALERKPAERGREHEQTTGGSDEFRAWLRGEGPRFYDVNPSGNFNARVNSRSLLEGAYSGGAYGGSGGDNVPISFYDRLVAHLIENAAIMQAGVTVLNTSGGEVMQIPKTTAHGTAEIVSEGGTILPHDPTFAQASLGAYKYGTLIQISRELLDDNGVDLEGYLAMQAGRALGNQFGAHLVTGDGSGKPTGVLNNSTLGKTGAGGTAGAFSGDDLIDLHYSVIAPYRASRACRWLMKDTTVGAARKLKDNNGQYLWQPSLQVGAPDMLLGKPVLTDPNVPGVAAEAKSVVFGDFSQYFVRLVGGVRFERSDEYAFNTDLVTYRALMRGDGVLVDQTGAVKHFAGGTA